MALVFLAALGACGAPQAHLKVGVMPAAGSFAGRWFSPVYGNMELNQAGETVFGSYANDTRRGRLEGRAQGDVLRFHWKEKRELVQGHPTKFEGRGYFRYVIGQDERHYLVGEWGEGEAEIGGGHWRAYKIQRPRMPPPGEGASSSLTEEFMEPDMAF